MEGKIDEHGNLFIERAGKLKKQFCMRNLKKECGDWCPAFGEPEAVTDNDYKKTGETSVFTCCGPIDFDEFEDLR